MFLESFTLIPLACVVVAVAAVALVAVYQIGYTYFSKLLGVSCFLPSTTPLGADDSRVL